MPLDSLNGIVDTLVHATEVGLPVELNAEGNIALKTRGRFRGSDHDAIVRSVVTAATRDGLNGETVAKFREALTGNAAESRAFRADILEGAMSVSALERFQSYKPIYPQPTVLYGEELRERELALDAQMRGDGANTITIGKAGDLMADGTLELDERPLERALTAESHRVTLAHSLESSTQTAFRPSPAPSVRSEFTHVENELEASVYTEVSEPDNGRQFDESLLSQHRATPQIATVKVSESLESFDILDA